MNNPERRDELMDELDRRELDANKADEYPSSVKRMQPPRGALRLLCR